MLRRLLALVDDDRRGRRDRAVLLVGFAGALRRSELAAIRCEHLEVTERGLRLTLTRLGAVAVTAQSVARSFRCAVAAGFGRRELDGHSLKRGALTTGMGRGAYPAQLKPLG